MSVDVADKLVVRCPITGKEKETSPRADGKPAVPPHWTEVAGVYYSPKGWQKAFYTRSLSITVASVALGYDGLDWSADACAAAWKEFRASLRASWLACSRASNWALRELACRDNAPLVPDRVGRPSLPPFPFGKELLRDLYHGIRGLCPDLDSQSVGQLRNEVVAAYKESRFAVRVTCAESLPSFTYPTPVPIPEKDSPITLTENGQPLVRCRLAGQRFTLRLDNSYRFARQIAGLKRALGDNPDAARGDLSLHERPVSGHNRSGGSRRGRGGNRVPTVVTAAVTIYLPRGPAAGRSGTIQVVTSRDCLWEVYVGGRREPWLLHDDHVGRRIAEHMARLKRLSDDQKFERRRPAEERADINGFRAAMCRRHNAWLDDYCNKPARLLAGLVERHRAACVEYDDRERGRYPSFPWFNLRRLARDSVEENGATFVAVAENGDEEDD